MIAPIRYWANTGGCNKKQGFYTMVAELQSPLSILFQVLTNTEGDLSKVQGYKVESLTCQLGDSSHFPSVSIPQTIADQEAEWAGTMAALRNTTDHSDTGNWKNCSQELKPTDAVTNIQSEWREEGVLTSFPERPSMLVWENWRGRGARSCSPESL